jgi:hypothetical protein
MESTASTLAVVADQIARHPEEPGTQIGFGPPRAEVCVQPQEGFLDGVVRLFHRATVPAQVPEQSRAMLVEKTHHLRSRVGSARQAAIQHTGNSCIWSQTCVLASLLIVCRLGGLCKENERAGKIFGPEKSAACSFSIA